MEVATIIYFLIGIILGFAIGYLISKETINKLKREEIKLITIIEEKEKNTNNNFNIIQKTMEETFENISNKVLKTQKIDFEKEQKDGITNIMLQTISPFKQDIANFKSLIERVNETNKEDKGYLKKEISDLKNINTNLNKNTNDLLNALKGNSKLQGDWGEIQLKNILDMAEFREGIDYQMQYNIKGEQNENLRPDCVIFMPDGKKLIIDSKVSISDYISYIQTENSEEAKHYLNGHIVSIKNHIKELSSKNYQKFLDGYSLDFVFMFIPNEHAYIEALKNDNTIYNNAYKNNIAITTPSSILPILRTVKNLWNIEKQNENANKIAKKAGQLYDKLVGFVDNMNDIDKGITNARRAYDQAFSQLKTGRGNAISLAENMKHLGAATIKSLPSDITETENLLEDSSN